MSTDKSWIHLTNRNLSAFKDGLNSFIETCKAVTNSDGKAYCPCKQCVNRYLLTPKEIRAHIFIFGFCHYYEFWDKHGEERTLDAESIPYYFPQTGTSAPGNINDELLNYIEDLRGEHNTNEEENSVSEDVLENDELFQELNKELYPGCTWLSSLNFLATMLHLKVINKWTDTSFTQFLKYLNFAFPKGNLVPPSFYEAKKKMRKIGLGYENIHACANDCALFWKENAEKDRCPICKESRWVDENTKGQKVPKKVLRYFPLTPRLRRMYGSKFTAKDMVWHNTGRSTDGMLRHPVDGKAWMDFDDRYPDFSLEPRNVRLGLAADGFNPFGNMSLQYSMWPVVLTTYNTPPWVCMKESSFMLTLLIPGPKSPAKDIDVYLRPLVDELKMLWSDGVRTRDAATNTVFTMRASLLWTINDYPARSSLSGWSGQGYNACPTCNIDTPGVRLESKMGYIGHRRFLPKGSKLRKNLLFDGTIEKRLAPKRLTEKEILEQLSTLPDLVPGKQCSKQCSIESGKRKNPEYEHNWKKYSIFYELEYWSSRELKHNLDVMHIEKNVCESVLGTLLMNKQSKDTVKARHDLEKMGIRPDLWIKEKKGKDYQPHASYSFTPVERAKFCQFIKEVRLPDGFGSNFRNKVDAKHNHIYGLKSHDHHILMQRLLPIGVRAGLPENVSTAIIDLCTLFKKICARTIDLEDMRKTNDEVVKILCNLELIFPPAFFDIMVHLVLHLPEEAILGGPVYMRWMYPFERYMKKLKAYVRNKAKPEGSIAEGYVADEALTFSSMYMEGVKTKFNCPDRNDDGEPPKTQFSVFSSSFRTLFATDYISLSESDTSSLQWFVLINCDEVKEYISSFESEHPGMDKKTHFPSWFADRVTMSPTSTKEIKALAHGILSVKSYSGCIVNGVRFVAYGRDVKRTTQNSGVVSFGEDNTPFYGQLEEVLLLEYLYRYSVLIFRSKWFDTQRKGRLVKKNNAVYIDVSLELYVGQPWYDSDRLILAAQAKQVFYIQDPVRGKNWRVVEEVHHRKMWDHPSIDNEKEMDVLHETQSSDYQLAVEEGCEVGTSYSEWEKEIQDAIDNNADDDIEIEIVDEEEVDEDEVDDIDNGCDETNYNDYISDASD